MATTYDLEICQGASYTITAEYMSGEPLAPTNLTGYSARAKIYTDWTKSTLILSFTPTVIPLTGTVSYRFTPQQTAAFAPVITRPSINRQHLGVYEIQLYTQNDGDVISFYKGDVWVSLSVAS